MASSPHLFEVAHAFGDLDAIPVVSDIQQVATLFATC